MNRNISRISRKINKEMFQSLNFPSPQEQRPHFCMAVFRRPGSLEETCKYADLPG
jgi:hypothetical protein